MQNAHFSVQRYAIYWKKHYLCPKNLIKMKKKLLLLLAFVVLGIIQAAIFMFIYSDRLEPYSFAQCLLALIYALPQSLMVASWVMLPAFAMGFVYVWIRGDWHRRFMIGYVTMVFMPLSLLCFIDWILYDYWGFRLDTTPFIYVFDNPIEALKECPGWAIPVSLCLIALFSWLLCKVMQLVYPRRRSGSITRMNMGAAQQREGLCNLLLAVMSGIVGAGCFGLMSISSSYHTDQQPLNHAATSPIYSFFHAWRQQGQPLAEQYRYMSEEERQQAVQEWEALATTNDTLTAMVTSQPDVLLIFLESFSGSACHYINPEADERVMPNVSRAMAEGIAFKQCYANSFRTERGLVSVLSAIPGQPNYSVMTDEERSRQLPYLTHAFDSAGYSLEFITGGDGKFCGLPNYLASAGIHRVTDRTSFDDEQHDCLWGMHDGAMYDFVLDRLKEESALANDTAAEYPAQPFFKVFTTISSHEPFDVPTQTIDDPYLNSVAYADSCLGSFLDALRADTLLWRNLLVIGVSDHAYANYPQGIQIYEPERYHIPMFWTGGAVRGHLDVNAICQQTDLAATLCNLLSLPHDPFAYSHDIFDVDAPHYAFYTWPDGFGVLSDTCSYIQDNHYDTHPLPGSNDPDGAAQRFGKAYLQAIYSDLGGMKP